MVILRHTAELTPAQLAGVRALCEACFRDFGDHDWDHALGGQHALVHDGGVLVGHGSLVLRRVLVAGRWRRCGYVEAVAVDPVHRGRGHAHAVMGALEGLEPGYELLALCASRAGRPLYESRGWRRWRGPTMALTPEGVRPTPEEDSIYVRGVDQVDADGPLTCDWREGDAW